MTENNRMVLLAIVRLTHLFYQIPLTWNVNILYCIPLFITVKLVYFRVEYRWVFWLDDLRRQPWTLPRKGLFNLLQSQACRGSSPLSDVLSTAIISRQAIIFMYRRYLLQEHQERGRKIAMCVQCSKKCCVIISFHMGTIYIVQYSALNFLRK